MPQYSSHYTIRRHSAHPHLLSELPSRSSSVSIVSRLNWGVIVPEMSLRLKSLQSFCYFVDGWGEGSLTGAALAIGRRC